MKATVVTRFEDVILKRIFEVGENYPVDKLEENRVEERVNLLSKPHPKTGKVYIFIEQEEAKATQQNVQNDEPKTDEQEAQQIDNKEDAASEPVEEKPKRGRRASANKDGE